MRRPSPCHPVSRRRGPSPDAGDRQTQPPHLVGAPHAAHLQGGAEGFLPRRGVATVLARRPPSRSHPERGPPGPTEGSCYPGSRHAQPTSVSRQNPSPCCAGFRDDSDVRWCSGSLPGFAPGLGKQRLSPPCTALQRVSTAQRLTRSPRAARPTAVCYHPTPRQNNRSAEETAASRCTTCAPDSV